MYETERLIKCTRLVIQYPFSNIMRLVSFKLYDLTERWLWILRYLWLRLSAYIRNKYKFQRISSSALIIHIKLMLIISKAMAQFLFKSRFKWSSKPHFRSHPKSRSAVQQQSSLNICCQLQPNTSHLTIEIILIYYSFFSFYINFNRHWNQLSNFFMLIIFCLNLPRALLCVLH